VVNISPYKNKILLPVKDNNTIKALNAWKFILSKNIKLNKYTKIDDVLVKTVEADIEVVDKPKL
jgi:hypothetical protein